MKSKVKRLSIITAIVCVAIALVVGSILIFNKNNQDKNPAKGVLIKIVGTSTENTGAASSDIQEKGGAIYVGYNTEYQMTGGVISGHYNIYGGAVYVAKGGVFTMTDGIITNCEAEYGGAIYVENGGRCVIEGGEILNNRSCSAPIFLESGAVLEILDESIIHDNQVVEKYYVNFFADGILIESRKVITNVYDLDTAVLPFTLDECSGYYLDEECKQPIQNKLINFEDNEYVVDGELNLYTNIATLEEFEFTYDKTQKFYNIQIDESGLVKNLVMPACYEGIPVRRVKAALNLSNVVKSVKLSSNITIIHTEAFIGATGLTDIYLPDGVGTIGESAFEGCTNLKTIRIPDSVYKMNVSCFEQCTSLVGPIKIPEGETKVYNRMFYNCTSLTGVEIPEGVTEIGANAFYECDAITSFDLPDSLQTIGTYAFIRCSGISEITIPEGVTELNQSTFSRCNNLRTVNLPSTLQSMANYVFSNCTSLTTINLPDGLTTMKTGVFSSCDKLQTIYIPISVESMGSGTFENCVEMQSIYCAAPEKPADWHDGWLGDCTATVYWSGIAIKTINFYVDGQFNSTLTVNADYVIEEDDMPLSYESCCGYFLDEYLTKTIPNGVIPFVNNTVDLYTKEVTNLSKLGFSIYEGDDTYSVYTTSTVEGEIVLPREHDDILVTKIGSCAFEESNVTKVTLSDSIDTIGVDAFTYSTVSEIILHDNFKILQDAFYYCSNLEKIYISKNVEEIGGSAFEGVGENTVIYLQRKSQPSGYADNWDYECSADLYWGASIENYINGDRQASDYGDFIIDGTILLDYIGTDTNVVIPAGVTEIGELAFYDNDTITSVTIPDGVTSIGDSAFCDCSSLTSITLPDSVTSIGEWALSSCSSLTSITIPEVVTSIGDYAFTCCSSLTSITLPDSVTSIGEDLFSFCYSLTSVTIPEGVTSIEDYAFYDCTSLTSITLPDSVTSIGDSAFRGCSSLKSITIPEGVTSIGELAFYNCSSLKSITIPKSVTTIERNPFGFLTSITVEQGNTVFDTTAGLNALVNTQTKELVRVSKNTNYNLINDIVSIGEEAFEGCDLVNYVIPEGVTSIGERAFYYSSLISIYIPSSVANIGTYYLPFRDCSSSLVIFCGASEKPSGWSDNWNHYDYDNHALTVKWGYTRAQYEEEISNVENFPTLYPAFTFSGSVITGYTGTGTNVAIPAGVTEIGDRAFYENDTITSVTIPEGVTSIGYSAFMNCSRLTEINLPTSLTSIEGDAFCNCDQLTGEVVIPNGVTEIKSGTFLNCSAITSIIIPDSVTTIYDRAFRSCRGLTSIYIPSSVTNIINSYSPKTDAIYQVFSLGSDLVIYCGAQSKLEGWVDCWNYNGETELETHYGYTRAQYEAETQTGASSFAPVKQNQEIFENIYDMQAVDVALNNLKFAYIKEN